MSALSHTPQQHLVLIGFKNAGKSTLGALLAAKLEKNFWDLDDGITQLHEKKKGESFSCREIMKNYGEDYFRELEYEALQQVLQQNKPLILALGGGTPMTLKNREILRNHRIIYVVAPKSVIFERIMINGKPAFFPEDKEPLTAFEEIWNEREPVYRELAHLHVDNSTSPEKAVENLLKQL